MEKKYLFLIICFIVGFVIQPAFAQVPEWVKNTAGWWAEGAIEDKDFVKGIEFLLNEKIIDVDLNSAKSETSESIPEWVKNTAGWWSEGAIEDKDFLNGIKYIVENGIISIKEDVKTQEELFVGGFDLTKAGPMEGSTDAKFTIIMFSDHQCKKCVDWLNHEKEVISEKLIDTGIAKFVILDYPMLGDDSVTAAEAIYCAQEQNKYSEYHMVLNKKYSGVQNGWASFESLVEYADEVGLDVEAFDNCLFWDKQGLRVDHNRKVGLSHGVVGTPTFFVIGPDESVKKIVGSQPPMIFESVIKEMS